MVKNKIIIKIKKVIILKIDKVPETISNEIKAVPMQMHWMLLS